MRGEVTTILKSRNTVSSSLLGCVKQKCFTRTVLGCSNTAFLSVFGDNLIKRRMRCTIFTLLVYLFTCDAKDVDLRLSPICILKNERVEQPCAYFKERPVDKLGNESWTEQAIKTEDGERYTNISITFARKYETNPVIVMVRYNQFPLPEQSWEIQPIGKDKIDVPFLMTIAFAPTTTNLTRYMMRRIVNPSKLLDETGCNKTETSNECRNLKTAKLYMRKTRENALTLTMSQELASSSLDVEVLSAQCNITCRGDINPCSSVEIRNLKWESPLEELKIFNSKNSSDPVYYCARISPANHECCMIYTETVLLSFEQPRKISVTFSQKIYLPECFMVLSISLALLVSAMITIRRMFGESSHNRCWPYYVIRPQGSVDDSRLLNSLNEETTPSKNNADTTQIPQQPVEVLLIYPKESETMEKLMTKFRSILSFYVTKVWDPLDELEIEKVSESPNLWLENFLSSSNIKVIVHEDCITSWYESYIRGHPTLQYHYLDSLGLYTVDVLHHNPYLCHNYRRVFIVRFPGERRDVKSTNIVPCTRYEIPRNLNKLITDLVGTYSSRPQTECEIPSREIEELESIVNEYKQEKITNLEKSV